MINTNFCRQKHQKVTIFQNQGGGQMPPSPPNDVPAIKPQGGWGVGLVVEF